MQRRPRIAVSSRMMVGACLIAAFVATGCTGQGAGLPTSPSRGTIVDPPAPPFHPSPTPGPPPAPPADPPSSAVALRGRVSEAPPTSLTEIYPALVRIVDGIHAGKSAETDANGFYSIPGLVVGTFTVEVSAEGYVGVSRTVNLGPNMTVNFQLLPVPETMRFVLNGDIRANDGTCSDGVSQRPCRIVTFPVHNDGVIEAALAWTPDRSADLDLTLFRTGADRPLARSARRGPTHESVSQTVTGGVTYELRITYGDGTADAEYELTLGYPR